MSYAYNDPLHHVIGNALNDGCKNWGVISGLAVSEKAAGANMSVDVALGVCFVDGTEYTESSVTNVVITAADGTNPRKDLIIYDTSGGTPAVVTGTPAATAIPPDITAGDILLAVVDVPANDTTITNDQIHDGRVFVQGVLSVAQGGTGVTGSGSVADVNADKVDGCSPGTTKDDVYKVPNTMANSGGILYFDPAGVQICLPTSVSGYQLTQDVTAAKPYWAASSDLIFSDTHCPKCGKAFEDGEILVLYLIGHNEIGDILTIPMHQSCANAPKKTVTIRRKVMEDQFIFDEDTGEPKVQRVQKMQEKTVTKRKLKDGVEFNNKTGEFWQMDDGKRKRKIAATDAINEIKETAKEVVYEDMEFEL